MPERFRDVDRARDDSAVIVGLGACSESSEPSGPIPWKRSSTAKAARVVLPFPATFMPLLMDFWSQACLSSLEARYMSQPSMSSFVIASTRRSQSRLAPGTSPHTRLKSLAQSSYNAGHQISQSAISFCHSVSHLSGPPVGQSTYFDTSSVRCLALTTSFIWASVGFVEVWRFVIQIRTGLSACNWVFLVSETLLRILVRSFASSLLRRAIVDIGSYRSYILSEGLYGS